VVLQSIPLARVRLGLVPVLLVFVAQATMADPAMGCFNEGAYWKNNANGSEGVRALVEFVDRTADSGHTIVHPMQVSYGALGDFVGWGTYNGEGNGLCSNDYSDWNSYVDGRSFDVYFCRDAGLPTFTSADDGTSFRISQGYCGTYLVYWTFKFYAAGNLETCEAVDFESNPSLLVGGEVPAGTANQQVDVHYYNIDRQRTSDDAWVSWGGTPERCQDYHYRVRDLATDNVWVEAFPW
jgi:hypothetical protein